MYDPALMFTIPRLAIVRYAGVCAFCSRQKNWFTPRYCCCLSHVMSDDVYTDQMTRAARHET